MKNIDSTVQVLSVSAELEQECYSESLDGMREVDCIDAESTMQYFLNMLDSEHQSTTVQVMSLIRQSFE